MKDILAQTAKKMVASGKGLLAADESTATIKKRFDSINLESSPHSRLAWRELLLRTEKAMKNYISGVILFEETLEQKSAHENTPLTSLITQAGSLPGIKVDSGAKNLAGSRDEKVTEGLDGLRERLSLYKKNGACFAKWRGVLSLSKTLPSSYAIRVNIQALARYAALCQEAGIVPIVEPELLMDGDHSIDRCFEATSYVLQTLYEELYAQRVFLEGSILKPNMVVAGAQCQEQASHEEIAEKTVQCLRRHVPSAVPGIAFLSGGQSEVTATANLNAINLCAHNAPWKLTFSYGRALQASSLKSWHGKEENAKAAREVFLHRAHMNSLAAKGEWNQQQEKNT